MATKILIFDDPTSLPRFIALELQAEGYQVSVIYNSLSDRAIAQMQPNVILLNWDLRRTSIRYLCLQLRSAYEADYRPTVIAMVNDESNCYLSQEVGMQSCLLKPFSMSDLLSAIESHLQGTYEKRDTPFVQRETGVAVTPFDLALCL